MFVHDAISKIPGVLAIEFVKAPRKTPLTKKMEVKRKYYPELDCHHGPQQRFGGFESSTYEFCLPQSGKRCRY
jgi:hypothetical protein